MTTIIILRHFAPLTPDYGRAGANLRLKAKQVTYNSHHLVLDLSVGDSLYSRKLRVFPVVWCLHGLAWVRLQPRPFLRRLT